MRTWKKTIWTLEMLETEALKYDTRAEFREHSNKAYQTASRRKLLGTVCSHMETVGYQITNEEIKKEALSYTTRWEYQKNSRTYSLARTRNIMEEACSHMDNLLTTWDEDNLRIEALKYEYRNEFQTKNESAYRRARHLGIIDDVCSHMDRDPRLGGNNCLYVWQIEDTNIYKIGITSMKLGYSRIESVANKHNVKPVITAYVKVDDAKKIENELHKIYRTPQNLIIKGDGYTEFKTLTRTELIEILDYLNQEKTEGVLNYPL